jgi:protein-S-isoprenylcysteine O-methyltransferase Ste14
MPRRNARQNPHFHDPDHAGEHPLGDLGQIAIAFLFLATWAGDTFLLKYTTFLNSTVPNSIRVPLGTALLLLSLFLANRGLFQIFGEKKKDPGVVRKGVFGVVRHPVYLSEILFYFGLLMFSLSLAAASVWGISIVFFRWIAAYEEKLCITRYGAKYTQYMRDVPMWIPRVWRRKR